MYAALSCAVLFACSFGSVSLLGADLNAAATVQTSPPSYRDIVKQVLPAIVSIESQAHQTTSKQQAPNLALPNEWRFFFDKPPAPTTSWFGLSPEQTRRGAGSGFIIDPSGVVVTANHVVQGADEVTVRLQDGRKFVTNSIKSDPKTDLAIVRIETKDPLPALQWGDSAAMEIGDRVLAVGAPYGLEGTVTQGIVSGKGRSLRLNMYEDFIQTDAAINPGNSGGPLINMNGQVIGVNSVIKTQSGGFQGVGLAVSSDLAKQVTDQLLKEGTVKRGFLGVQIGMLRPEVAERLGMKEHRGLLVSKVFDNSPAAKAGLKEGDVITALDGKNMGTPTALAFSVARLLVGKTAELTIWRDGRSETLRVTIEQQPDQFGLGRESESTAPTVEKDRVWLKDLGIAIANLTKESAARLGFSDQTEGALIVDVERGSVAGLAGLRTGDLIQKVDGKLVTSAKAAEQAVTAGSLQKGILMQTRSEDQGLSFVMLRATND